MEWTVRELIEEISTIKAIKVLNLQCKEYSDKNMDIDSLCYKRIKELEAKLKEIE